MIFDHVSFTGTRAGMTNAQKETFWALLQELGAKTFTHGNCIGADSDAHGIALRLGLHVRKRPSNIPGTWASTEGGEFVAEPEPPLKRNKDIVDDGQALIATPDSRQEKRRAGAWAPLRYAWSRQKMVYVIFPDGGVVCGNAKEECSELEPVLSRVITGSDELLIKCGSCSYYHTHRADLQKVTCANHHCKRTETLDMLRQEWNEEGQELVERLGSVKLRAITEFKGDYRWLSNFWDAQIECVKLDGDLYRSVENAYQAAKTLDRNLRKRFVDISPGDAKKLGNRIELRSDWESVKLGVMEDLLRQKFSGSDNKRRLLETGSAELVEGNYWGDRFWGVDQHGWNHLGELLMKIRGTRVADED